MPRGKQSKRSKAGQSGVSTRTTIVWGALLASMTAVGGLMYGLHGGPAPRIDGLALPAAFAAAGPSTVEPIFRTRTAIEPGRWKAIIIHHSGSGFGTPASIEAKHRQMNLEGLGFHFVVGNGSGMDDGEVHVGYRWLEQLPGAHTVGRQGDWFNRNAIGVCLVGDGRRRPFSPEQTRRLVQVVASLAEQLKIPADRIYLHGQVSGLEDPGPMFPEAAFREQLRHLK